MRRSTSPGSNTLRAQIDQGAQADVFASANVKEMDALVTSGLVADGAPQTFLTNRLVVITPTEILRGYPRSTI